jgi:N-acetylmuramoyl-L-alanine amidase
MRANVALAFTLKFPALRAMVRRLKEGSSFVQIRVLLILICGWLAGNAAAAPAAPRTLNAQRMAGGSYVAVNDLARCYNLGANRDSASDAGDYRTTAGELTVHADQREIVLNGIQHWLSAPVLEARGRLWISATDVLKAIDPVLRQGRSKTPSFIRTIIIDPGHGGTEPGTRGHIGIEKQLTLDLASRVKTRLETAGLTVYLTRRRDLTLSLQARDEYAEDKGANLFVSIHLNSGGNASGIETYCMPPAGAVSTASAFRSWAASRDEETAPGNRYDEKNIWLAHCVQKALVKATGAVDRGVRRARFHVIEHAPCPAILIEGGFLSNRTEEQKLLRSEYRDTLAKAITDGILTYRTSVQ